MNTALYRLYHSKHFLLFLLIVDIFFSLIRLVNLNADFPSGITTSGTLYTDEGWYSAAAIRHYLTGEWHLDGDINTAVVQPGGQVLYRLSFALFGLSLSSVRIIIVLSFFLIILCIAFWIRRYYGDFAALLSGLILSSNYFAFAYSRLALRYMIALAFIALSFLVVEGMKEKRRFLYVISASLLLAYGILTSTTTVFALPLLLFLLWKKGKNRKEKLLLVMIACLLILTLVGTYMILVKNLYPVDVANDTVAVRGLAINRFSDWPLSFVKKIYHCIIDLGSYFTLLTLLLTISAFLVSKKFRSNPLVQVLIGFIAIYILMLSINQYDPPRYYLMLILPFAGLCAIACVTLVDWLREHKLAKYSFIPLLFVVLVSARDAWRSGAYIANPKYSFYQMAQGVKNIIQQREGTTKNILLFGDLPDSISLVSGTNSANSGMWTRSTVQSRLKEYHPNYLIVHTSNIEKDAASLGGVVTELGRWDVFGNYYGNGEQVRLYYVAWPAADASSGEQKEISVLTVP